MYDITLYQSTGFNPVNIPDSPGKLAIYDSKVLPSLDIMQDDYLQTVSVKCTYADVVNADYCKVGSIYYFVTNAVMTSPDVAMLALTPDYLTTAGGPASLEYLDGITDRHTVSDDTMFAYPLSDEYTAPAEPLQIVTGQMVFGGVPAVNTPIVESTIDLSALSDLFDDEGNIISGTGMTFANDSTGETVTVPYVEGVKNPTQYLLNNRSRYSPKTKCYSLEVEKIQKAMAMVRSLGVESSIVSQILYPTSYFDVTVNDKGEVGTISGKPDTDTSGLPFEWASVKNKRLLYGEYCKYGLVTTSGSKGEYLPEQIAGGSATTPNVTVYRDPKPGGKPYFRYEYLFGDNSENGFWLNCVDGSEWENVPLVWQGASGSYQSQINFDLSNKRNAMDYTYNQAMAGINMAQSGVSGIAGAIGSGLEGKWGQLATGVVDATFGMVTQAANIAYSENAYKQAQQQELYDFGFSQAVTAPTVAIPFNASVLRDFFGNGVYTYRYKYTDNDVARIDRLLTMYGYKDKKALVAGDFSRRLYFDYVRANGVSIGGTIPLRWKKGISAQLSAGVRVWHTTPDQSCYTNNPIK